jgi:hypothetical protein
MAFDFRIVDGGGFFRGYLRTNFFMKAENDLLKVVV